MDNKVNNNRGYLQKTIALRDGSKGPDRSNWEQLEQIGWTPIEIWRLGVGMALTQEHNATATRAAIG